MTIPRAIQYSLSLLALLSTPAAAAPDLFAASDPLRRQTEGAVRNDRIDPVWLDEGKQLWFRTVSADGAGEYHLVNAEDGAKRPLFDHARLREALNKAGLPADQVKTLRLDNVVPDTAAGTLGFQLAGKAWTWSAGDGSLSSGQGAGGASASIPRASRSGGPEMHFKLRNESGAPVKLWWLNAEGQRQDYGRVPAGGVNDMHTFTGHVWLVTGEGGKELLAFVADPANAEITVKEAVEIRWAEPERPRGRGRRSDRIPDSGAKAGDKSPDGKWSAFIRDHNLFVRAADGKETALSTDGSAEDRYEGPLFWSPDSSRVAAMRVRPVEERKVTVVRSSPKDQLQPKVESWDYAKPGDALMFRRPVLFDPSAGKRVSGEEKLYANPFGIDEFHWAPDSSAFHFLYNERGHQLLRLVALQRDGTASALFEEKAETFVDYSQKTFLHWLDGTGEFLWMSERSGWNHLYLCDARTGAVKNAVTQGEWVLRNVERVDVGKRQIEFRCMGVHPGQDPYHMHYGRVNFDGSGLVFLTQSDGTHEITWAPDRRTFLAAWSRVDQAPVHELRRADDGKLLCGLNRADDSALRAAGRPVPQRFTAKGRDGKTDICGMILRPWNFDAAKKYPVIEYIYAGPHDFFVPKQWQTWFRHWELGNLGFILVFIDGMGTNWRSRAFHDVAWRNIGDAGFPDRIAWMKAAAAQHPEMDLSRVGIFGGSAGGQNAMRALIAHGDFYHCAAADCGCHDNRMDKIWWNEAWMGWPIGPHYIESSNAEQAHRLKGHLLLTAGEVDSNVDPASTMQVVNALIKADKDFELLIVPNANHGAGESPYASRRRAKFFQRYLLGAKAEPN
jgi:dipeptidyl aminopeptidase/acylaminoacyl peptidase